MLVMLVVLLVLGVVVVVAVVLQVMLGGGFPVQRRGGVTKNKARGGCCGRG